MHKDAARWELMYNQTPLCDVARHYAGMNNSPFLLQYLSTILKLCPSGGRTCETGIGSGYGAIWLSLRGVRAEGIDYAPGIVERARQINNLLEGSASFQVGDLFDFYSEGGPRYDVIHHQGVLEHFTAPQIRAALAQQVASASWVVFSVPSVYYPFEPEFGDERLLPLEEWKHLLSAFDIEELRYYGDPQFGEREHILCVLRGQTLASDLESMMTIPSEPYPEGISAIVHTRNEARHIGDCLKTLKGWTDEIIVCDMESADATVSIASEFTSHIIHHPLIPHFDRARNVSTMRASRRWVFFLDADERVPPGLGPALLDMIAKEGTTFAALLLPFRHFFAGRWMQCLYPGYTAPRLLKNGKFVFRSRLHSGAQVDGRIDCFPADNPDLALVHYSFDSMSHYLDKLNRYTDGEAASMHRDGVPYHWQNSIAHFVEDFKGYYERGQATKDGVHGFIYSFHSAFYRFEQHAKLYEKRFQNNQLQPEELAIPASVEQMLEYALALARQRPKPQAEPLRIAPKSEGGVDVVWNGPLHDPSGYGEESRNFLFALEDTGVSIAAQAFPWSEERVDFSEAEQKRLELLEKKSACPGFIQIIQNFPVGFQRHPEAGTVIGRTMFETDRLPAEWVEQCNRMDYIWVPSEFNRQSFTDAGVAPEKLVVIPGCLDPTVFRQHVEPTALSCELEESGKFVFLSVFDWTRHKGWDALLRGFIEAFEGSDEVMLVLKAWSTMGYASEQIAEQARTFLKDEMGVDLDQEPRIRFIFERLPRPELLALYQSCNAFVLPSRGEGWGRPFMEAMALGKPTIGTNWSGNTAFMNSENSYLVDYSLTSVPEAGWKEIPTYQGHRWAEPDLASLKAQMRRVVSEREEAIYRGNLARDYILNTFSRERIGKLLAREIARLQEQDRPQLTLVNTEQVTSEKPVAKGSVSRKRAVEKAPEIEKYSVRLEGAQFSWHSLGHVNRQIALGMLDSNQIELSLVPTEMNHFDPMRFPAFQPLAPCVFASLSRKADVHIRHFFPPRFEKPAEGKLVLIQPWEYGYLPEAWIKPIKENVSEVWCYSSYVRDVYLASGIPNERLQVIPLGVDADTFRPAAPPYIFTTEAGAASVQASLPERFVFLFVGGTLHRKGIDILLEAYQKAFSAYDEVCLVIKDTGTETVYRGQNERERIQVLSCDPTRPAVIYLDQDLSPAQLAGLYTASQCVVLPYRGEGFCLPALEALACGVPVIVPKGGPTDDFVDESVGWQIPAERRPFGNSRIGTWDCVGETWMLEVSPAVLGRQMRQVYDNRAEARNRGLAGVERVNSGWTWKDTGRHILDRLKVLREREDKPVPYGQAGVASREEKRVGRDKSPSVAIDSAKKREKSTSLVVTEAEESLTSDRRASRRIPPKRAMPKISLCMIVKNEERVLDDCLKSVKPFVDEIIVVDTGSTDRTIEIAKEHGVKLYHFPWRDDFSAARNVSLSHATGDWLFWMDADDTLPEECGLQLHETVFRAEDRIMGFLMQVHIPPKPGDDGFVIVDHLKLFRNLPELRFEGRLHEQILESINRAGGRIERANLYVVHSGYDYSPEGQERKRERDLRILALELIERPNHPFVHFCIGMTHHHLKNFPEAITALERSLVLSGSNDSTTRKVYAMLVNCYQELGDLALARERLEAGLSRTPNDPELLFRAGQLYRVLGDLEATERSYIHLLTRRDFGQIDSIDVSITGFKTRHNLALLYQDMNRLPEAEQQWRAALAESPNFVPSLLGLAELGLRIGNFNIVKEVLARLETASPEEAERLRLRIGS